VATLTSKLPNGPHTISANYNPSSGDFTGSSSASVQESILQHTKTTLKVKPLAPVIGQPVTLKAKVLTPAGVPVTSGVVEFFVDGNSVGTFNLDGTGRAVAPGIQLGGLGSHTVTATYDGTPLFATSTATVSRTVGRANTKIKLTGPTSVVFDPNNPTTAVYTAVISPLAPSTGNPPGTVQFYVDGVLRQTSQLDSSETVTLSISDFTLGTHVVKVVYLGSPNYAGSTKSLSVTVSRQGGRS
jgi:hypothetical protein